jgi:DNA-directed RNA polymerase subunit RPC12/RpoP
MTGFPAVYDTDWCGDHKLDETKLPLLQGEELLKDATCLWVPGDSDDFAEKLYYICPECHHLVQFRNDTRRGDNVQCPACLHCEVLE